MPVAGSDTVGWPAGMGGQGPRDLPIPDPERPPLPDPEPDPGPDYGPDYAPDPDQPQANRPGVARAA